MASLQSKTVVIVCPHCTTRYQVPGETVGAKGRQVQCAHCGKTWQAFAEKIIETKPAPPPPPAVTRAVAAREAEDDKLFDAAAEAELDAAFEAEQKAAAEAAAKAANEPKKPEPEAEAEIAEPEPPAKPADVAAEKKRQKAFTQRQSVLTRQLPMARVRRTARLAGVATLVGLMVGGYVFRTDVVRLVPDMAGAYELLGLGVNVIGLEFRDVKTLLVRHNGTDVMQVDAQIVSVAGGNVSMPPVVVTLVNDEGLPLYEWSVAPSVGALAPGEITDFSTKVNAPPSGATKVRLTFGTGQTQAPSLASEVPVADEAAGGHEASAAPDASGHETAASDAASTHESAPAHAEVAADHSGGGH
jgi:predicted Zn finger-like uncharacterized protein